MQNFFSRGSATSQIAPKKDAPKTEKVRWVERYRPKKVDDIVFQNEVVAMLKNVLTGADLPNLLFYGPPGTGKTSAAIAVCRQLFKTHEAYVDRVLEMNASDERGIQIVRTRIKEFAHRAVSAASENVCTLKIIILDEADAMTPAAQAAMRRTIEKYSKTTRFFLICNYVSRIIDPLTSRCAKFRFKPIPTDEQLKRLRNICENEKLSLDDNALKTLIELCEGDLRKSITYLQTLASNSNAISTAYIHKITGRIDDHEVSRLLEACASLNYETMFAAVELMRRAGYSAGQLISQLHDMLLGHDALNDSQKAEIFEKLAICEYRLMDGADEFLQVMDLACCILKQFETC